MEEAAILYYVFCIKVHIFPTLISIQVLLKAVISLFAPKLLFIEVFGVSVQLYLDTSANETNADDIQPSQSTPPVVTLRRSQRTIRQPERYSDSNY